MKKQFTIELRIYGKALDISKVSDDFGLSPTTVQLQGQLGSGNKPFKESMWGYGESEGFSLREWDELENGLESLLKTLEPVKDVIERYRADSTIYLWCGHFHSSWAPSITLSPSILTVIGKFGAILDVSSYYCESDEE